MTKGLFGRLPREEGKSAVAVVPSAGAAPTRPAEVHNIELDAADTNLYGNDVWGDCVWVMIEKDRVISAESLGVKITKLTPAQVIANYCDFTGVHTAPGPGSNILDALKWAQNHPERMGGSKLLFYGDVPINDESMKQAVAEFSSVCVGVVVYQSMEYPNKVWYNNPRGANVGGHGIAGGSYALYNFIKTWGYMVEINSAGFNTIDELVVCVWDFQWNALTYERQLACIASYQFATGKPWTGPAAIPPTPTRSIMANTYNAVTPFRAYDSRKKATPLRTGVPMVISLAGLIDPAAVAVSGNLTVALQDHAGYLAIGPDPVAQPSVSTLNFPVGDNRANGFISILGPNQTLAVTFIAAVSGAATHFIVDVTGAFLNVASIPAVTNVLNIAGTVQPDGSITDKE
jgi:hypothetical protein